MMKRVGCDHMVLIIQNNSHFKQSDLHGQIHIIGGLRHMSVSQLRTNKRNISKILSYQKDLRQIYGLRIWGLSLELEWWLRQEGDGSSIQGLQNVDVP